MPKVAEALRMFAPERWDQVDLFLHFYEHTYTFSARDRRAVGGVRNHFQKAKTLIGLAEKLRPNLQIDLNQLEQHGFTPAANAEEVATVIEAAILELYATLDCTVKVLRAVYGVTSPGFKDSTRKVFESPNAIKGSFPDELKTAISEARWYKRLLHLRDELTHLGTGRVTAELGNPKVRYDHFGISEVDTHMSIDDIFSWLKATQGQVNGLTGLIFRTLNQTLADKESFETCGMVQGRVLWRYVSPVGEVTFNSGRCGAWIWFDNPGEPRCPFVSVCGAYDNRAPAPVGDPPAILESATAPLEQDDNAGGSVAGAPHDVGETEVEMMVQPTTHTEESTKHEEAPRQTPEGSEVRA